MEFLTWDSLMIQNFSAISGCPWKLNHERQIPPCGTIWSQVGHQQDGVMLLLSLFRITSPTDGLPLLHPQHWRGVKCRWSLSVSLLSSDSRRMTCKRLPCPSLLSTLPIQFHPSDLNSSVPSVTPSLTLCSFDSSGLYLTLAVPASKHQTSLITALPV